MEDCARAPGRGRRGRRAPAGSRSAAVAVDPTRPPERLTVAEAFDALRRHRPAGDRWTRPARTDRDALAAAAARAAGIRVADDDSWADLFSRVLVERVEPRLGRGRATILCEYPVAEAALARPKPGDPRVAERFELYACGVELANGFGELTDPVEQRRRFEAEMDREGAALRRALPARRGLPRRPRPHAAGERHRARLRPAGDAGDRRAHDRARAVGAGGAAHRRGVNL